LKILRGICEEVAVNRLLAFLSSRCSRGTTVTFTATMTGAGTVLPIGARNFLDRTTSLGSGTLNASGAFALVTRELTMAKHLIAAACAGNACYGAATQRQ
jgi:large repetitive protein